jgi:hypothetical protein
MARFAFSFSKRKPSFIHFAPDLFSKKNILLSLRCENSPFVGEDGWGRSKKKKRKTLHHSSPWIRGIFNVVCMRIIIIRRIRIHGP